MANPNAFGQKNYTDLDRRRQLIDQSLSSTFETTNKIAQMQKQKEQENRIKAIAGTYQSAMQNPELTPEQKADVFAKAQTEFSGIGATEQAKGAADIAGVYSRIERPKPAKPEPQYLRTAPLKGGGRGLFYGFPASGTAGEVVTKVDQLTDKDLTGSGSGKATTDEELKAANMIKEQSAIATQAGADLVALDKQQFSSGAKDEKGNDIMLDPLSEAGKVKRQQIEATLKGAQNQVNQIQSIMSDKYGWRVTAGGKVIPSKEIYKKNYATPADVNAINKDKFTVGKKYTSNGITKTYLGNGKWK